MSLIPFNKPYMTGKELWNIAQAHAKGHLAGDGSYTKLCNKWIEQRTGSGKALLTHSCTAGLEMAALLADVGPGDEVIMPSYTFVSTANAFVLRGAVPVFVDVRPDTLNLDERQIESAITERTKVIAPVHYAGVGCEMDTIMSIAAKHKLVVIEDAAQALMSTYKGRPLGSIGDLGAISFHETKNIISGEGGALLVNNPSYAERAEIIREKGTNRSLFFRGQVDKYTWVDVGSSFLPSDILAAVLLAQFERAERIQARRRQICERYEHELQDWAEAHRVRLPIIPSHCDQSWHMYYLLLPSLDVRQRLITHLKQSGILAVFHYLPLHISDMGRKFGGKLGDCPVTEDVSDRLLRLPLYHDLSEGDQRRVIEAIKEFKGW